jgi:hypothetical protein
VARRDQLAQSQAKKARKIDDVRAFTPSTPKSLSPPGEDGSRPSWLLPRAGWRLCSRFSIKVESSRTSRSATMLTRESWLSGQHVPHRTTSLMDNYIHLSSRMVPAVTAAGFTTWRFPPRLLSLRRYDYWEPQSGFQGSYCVVASGLVSATILIALALVSEPSIFGHRSVSSTRLPDDASYVTYDLKLSWLIGSPLPYPKYSQVELIPALATMQCRIVDLQSSLHHDLSLSRFSISLLGHKPF